MLPAAMRRTLIIALCVLTALAVSGALAACGSSDNATDVAEGEPAEIAGLGYNVQLTRFLNPDDREDSEYLVGQPPAKPGEYYLGVFMVINNDTDTARPSAAGFTVVDTLHTKYEPLQTTSPYALEIGADVPPNGQLPLLDTTAQTGPNEGSMLIFRVSADVSDNRPLVLEINSADGAGQVLLDI